MTERRILQCNILALSLMALNCILLIVKDQNELICGTAIALCFALFVYGVATWKNRTRYRMSFFATVVASFVILNAIRLVA